MCLPGRVPPPIFVVMGAITTLWGAGWLVCEQIPLDTELILAAAPRSKVVQPPGPARASALEAGDSGPQHVSSGSASLTASNKSFGVTIYGRAGGEASPRARPNIAWAH
jgi:hypothetical protein